MKDNYTGLLTQEEKELLLKDLCTRLLYGVILDVDTTDWRAPQGHIKIKIEGVGILFKDMSLIVNGSYYGDKYKPYLRPMSSMTEEERKEYTSLCNRQDIDTPTWSKIIWHDTYKSIDWLNKKMFAYRTIDGKDMFELGLAIKAPEGMYER